MAITTLGKNEAFQQGIMNIITQVRLIGTTGVLGTTQNISMSRSTSVDGRAISDNAVSFNVSAGQTAISIVLANASGSSIWNIDLPQSYSFDVDGTLTLEEVYVQFDFDANALSNGGLTADGANRLILGGFLNEVERFQAHRVEGGGIFTTQNSIQTADGVTTAIDSSNFSILNGTFSYDGLPDLIAQIYINEFSSTFDVFSIDWQDLGGFWQPLLFFKFATTQSMPYPNNFTIEGFSVTIN